MKKEDFYYSLPENLIAQYPLEERDSSNLLFLDKSNGNVTDFLFNSIGSFFKKGDVLVLNNTRVIPARLFAKKKTGGNVEVFLIKDLDDNVWEVLLRPSAKVKKGAVLNFARNDFSCFVLDSSGGRLRRVKFCFEGDFYDVLENLGQMPLPPYVKRAPEEKDVQSYQTVFADKKGAVAAPTAGLHFTNDLLEKIKAIGVDVVYVTLHVGYGTFFPVKVDNIEEHKMHVEEYEIQKAVATKINQAKKSGNRIIACGTTSVRTLESSADAEGFVCHGVGSTDIFIYPPYRFKIVDGLITNFHLPESTLLMLVSAFAGRDKILAAYKYAINKEYRFFSYGDAMLIL